MVGFSATGTTKPILIFLCSQKPVSNMFNSVGSNVIVPYRGFQWRQPPENLSPRADVRDIKIGGRIGIIERVRKGGGGTSMVRVVTCDGIRLRHFPFFYCLSGGCRVGVGDSGDGFLRGVG